MNKGRRGLYFLAAAGLLSLGVGGGTFATFNAQTTNPNNTFSTGSLTLTDNASSTTCFSYSDSGSTTNLNTSGTSCGAAISLNNTNQTGSTDATGIVTLTNGGTIDPTTFEIQPPSATDCVDSYGSTNTVASVTLTSSSSSVTTTSSVSGITTGEGVSGTGIPTGTTVSSITPGTPNTIVLSKAATASATETLDFSIGTVNLDTSGTTLCGQVDLFAEEISHTTGAGSATVGLSCAYGSCPTFETLASTTSGASLTLNVGFPQTLSNGDTLELVTAAGVTQEVTVSGSVAANATTIPLTGTPAPAVASGSAVVDLNQIPAGGTSLTNFDTGSPTALTLSSVAGWTGPLPSADTRMFLVGVNLASAAGNSLQDLSSKFGISWYVQ